jgi:hypothetical protein
MRILWVARHIQQTGQSVSWDAVAFTNYVMSYPSAPLSIAPLPHRPISPNPTARAA